MSIINDALKKAHQGLSRKAEEARNNPVEPSPTNDYIYSESPAQIRDKKSTTKQSTLAKNRVKSIFSLIFAILFALGALGFLSQQLNTYCPQFTKTAKQSFLKLIHAKEAPPHNTVEPTALGPLARIPANSTGTTPNAAHKPLNIHGVMSNPAGNVVLINDQVYQEGDTIDGVKIVRINLNAIKVISNGKEEIIPVNN